MSLTDSEVKNFKPGAEPYKKGAGGGLYVLVKPDGSKYWRLKYSFAGKERLLALGVYPAVSLAKAREKREAARALIREGKDPGAERKAAKHARKVAAVNSFEAVAREYLAKQGNRTSARTASEHLRRLVVNIFPFIGNQPIALLSTKPREILAVLERIEKRKAYHLAHRVLQACSQVFRYGVRTERCESDPCRDLKGALTPHKGGHMKAVKPEELPGLLAKIDAYETDFAGDPRTRLAMRLMALTFLRTGEMIGKHDKATKPAKIIGAEWAEIDFDRAEWIVPASRMKMGVEHIVPLSRQSLAILAELQTINGDSHYIFAGRTAAAIMSENTITKALTRMGYKDRMTGHGFRTVASTALNGARGVDRKRLFDKDAIERQLAHGERDEVRAAYNRAEYIEERREMMQWWGDHLDALRGGNVVPLRRPA